MSLKMMKYILIILLLITSCANQPLIGEYPEGEDKRLIEEYLDSINSNYKVSFRKINIAYKGFCLVDGFERLIVINTSHWENSDNRYKYNFLRTGVNVCNKGYWSGYKTYFPFKDIQEYY